MVASERDLLPLALGLRLFQYRPFWTEVNLDPAEQITRM